VHVDVRNPAALEDRLDCVGVPMEVAAAGMATLAGMIDVLIVDDNALVRAALIMMLGTASDIRIIGEAGDGAEALDQVQRYSPQVILMDIRMPIMDGLEATEVVRALPMPPDVIVLTTFDADRLVLRALRAGASGFLLKDTPPDEIVAAVRQVAAGKPVQSPAATRQLIRRVAETDTDRREAHAKRLMSRLNDRELQVAIAVSGGQSNADIGASLYLSVPTVKAQVSAILTKLRLNNRVQIALLAHDAGLLEEP
jgi:DNA-binding NarL/FixJ family response regulator